MLLGWGDTADGTAFAMDNMPRQQQRAPQPPPATAHVPAAKSLNRQSCADRPELKKGRLQERRGPSARGARTACGGGLDM